MPQRQQSSRERSASARDRPGAVARGCAALIRVYQVVVRPTLPPACRFSPSCSEYARLAVLSHGALVGAWLAVRRISRCHAWHPGGYDPVPGSRG